MSEFSFPWEPTNEDISAILRTRTKAAFGGTEGLFGPNTRPTLEQVENILHKAANKVASRVGANEEQDICSTALQADAGDMATLLAAMRIEISYYTEQVSSGLSPYDQLKAEYDEGMKQLMESVTEQCGLSGGGESVGGQGTLPSAGFPPSSNVSEQIW